MPCKIQKVYDGRDVKEVTRDDEVFRLVSAETVKGKYSISAKFNDAFILKELYDLGLDIVFDECVDIILEYRTLLQKMVDAGVSAKSATAKAKKEAFDIVQARYIDKLGKDKYLEIFPMTDKKKAKTTKQRSKEQVREVRSTIKKIKGLEKELALPPEVTKPDDDVVSQINDVIANDETLIALKDTRDIEGLKLEKAQLEVPDIDLNIDLSLTYKEVKPNEEDKNTVFKNEVEISKVQEESKVTVQKVDNEVPTLDFGDDLEDFFADTTDGLF